MSFSHFAFIGWQVDLTGTGSFLLGSLSESPQQRLHTLGHGLCQPPECPSKELLSGWLWQRRQINSLPSHFPSLAFCRFKKKIWSSFKVAQLLATEILWDKWAKQKRTEVWYTLSKKCDSITNSALVFFRKMGNWTYQKSLCPKKLNEQKPLSSSSCAGSLFSV